MKIADLCQLLQPEFPGCPLATLRDQLRWAQRELCAEGNAWVHTDSPVVVGARSDEPEIEAAPGAEILRIFRLKDGVRELRAGIDYWQPTAATVAFHVSPAADELDGGIVCRPALGRDMPAALLARWSEAVLHGARYQLFLMPQPWRDPAMAEFYSMKFLSAQAEARHLATAGHQRGSLQMQVPRFV